MDMQLPVADGRGELAGGGPRDCTVVCKQGLGAGEADGPRTFAGVPHVDVLQTPF